MVECLPRDVWRDLFSLWSNSMAWITRKPRRLRADDARRCACLRKARFLNGDFMFWKKGWWDRRWIFLIGLCWIFGAYGLTFGGGDFDAGRWAARLNRSATLSENERQALNNYQGQAWALWFKMLLSFMCADLAVL